MRAYRSAADWVDKTTALALIAATAPETPDADTLAVIASALQDPEPNVRRIAVIAVSYMPWPEFTPLLESAAARDPDQDVRDCAASALAALPAPPPDHPDRARAEHGQDRTNPRITPVRQPAALLPSAAIGSMGYDRTTE